MKVFANACVLLLTVGLMPILGLGALMLPIVWFLVRLGFEMTKPQ